MGGREVGGQKWVAGEWRVRKVLASRTRVQCHGQGHSVTDEGTESPMRAQCHRQGCGEGDIGTTDEEGG